MIFTLIYISSIVYCLLKLSSSSSKRGIGYGVGETPALDTLMVVLLAPFLALMDLLITILNFIKRNT